MEAVPAPSATYLEFPPDAAFYRLFYKFWDEENTGQTIIVLAGSDRAQLESLSRELAADPAACDKTPRPMCRIIPGPIPGPISDPFALAMCCNIIPEPMPP